jgi:hypothetical protein
MNLRFWSCVLIIAMAGVGGPTSLLAAAQQTGSISGTAADASNQSLAKQTVRARNVSNGQVAGTAQTNAAGQYSISGLQPGQYIIEIVDAQGAVVATSGTVTLSAGSLAATGVLVTSKVTAAGLGAGIVGGTAGSFLTSATGLSILAIAGGVGLTTAVVTLNDPASPTQ